LLGASCLAPPRRVGRHAPRRAAAVDRMLSVLSISDARGAAHASSMGGKPPATA